MTGLLLLFLTAYTLIALIGSAVIVFIIVRPRRKTYATAIARDLPTDPSELGLSGEEVTFNLPGGYDTPGWIIPGKAPDGPTVLVLHGHRDFIYGAMRFVSVLAPFAGHIVLFDWPAHGGCTAPWMTCGKREPDDALAVIDGLPEAVSERPIVLFGYSLGGQIAIKTAGLHPDRFAGVIVDGAYRRWDTPIRMRLKLHRVPAFPFVHIVGVVFWLLGLIRSFDRARYAAQYPKPMLLIHGSDDRVCPIEEGRELADAAPQSAFVHIEGGRHNQLHEQKPEVYSTALKAYFDSLGPSEPT
ncbi:MAG: alpha/beta fold hydrolase [Planctomycetota bacterium]